MPQAGREDEDGAAVDKGEGAEALERPDDRDQDEADEKRAQGRAEEIEGIECPGRSTYLLPLGQKQAIGQGKVGAPQESRNQTHD